MNLGQSPPAPGLYLYHEATVWLGPSPGYSWSEQFKEEESGAAGWGEARCHAFPTPSAGCWMCRVCGQGLGQEEAWDTKEGEFHSPSSPLTPCLDSVLTLWRPRRSVLGQARVLGTGWLDSRQALRTNKLPMTGTLALLLQEQKGPPRLRPRGAHVHLSPQPSLASSLFPLMPLFFFDKYCLLF